MRKIGSIERNCVSVKTKLYFFFFDLVIVSLCVESSLLGFCHCNGLRLYIGHGGSVSYNHINNLDNI